MEKIPWNGVHNALEVFQLRALQANVAAPLTIPYFLFRGYRWVLLGQSVFAPSTNIFLHCLRIRLEWLLHAGLWTETKSQTKQAVDALKLRRCIVNIITGRWNSYDDIIIISHAQRSGRGRVYLLEKAQE